MKFNFIAEPSIDSIVRQLKRFGIALVPGFIDKEEIEGLNTEFFRALGSKNFASVNNRSQHPVNHQGKTARIETSHEKAMVEFPAITQVFGSDLMRQVAEAYYAPNKYLFNESIFVTNEFESEMNILPWHFDRIQSLKFWFNLTDTTRENGAFEYCPGTHWEGRYRAGYHMSQGCPVEEIPNDIDEDLILNPVCMELKAGDLLIFDADGFHRGGVVQPGKERRVLRAHTYPTGRRYGDRMFSRGWWVSSPLNINRWFKSSTTRMLGDRIQETTLNRSQHNISMNKNLDD